MYFFDKDGKLGMDAEVPQGAELLAECTMNLDGAIWFTPKSDKITTELEFNYDASETYSEAKNVPQVDSKKPGSAAGEEPAAPKFSDVTAGSPFAAAIGWAVEQGITAGYEDGTFRPGSTCLVSHILTFLWRANGKPGAAENGDELITVTRWVLGTGMDLGGDSNLLREPCTRAMAVTFMWNAAGSPEVETDTAFTDVAEDTDYAQAVAWAVEQGITAGTGDGTTFSPDNTCTRGQIVTFLYRALNK